MQDEQSLVRQAQQHDQEAFAQLYEEHFDKIYRYVTFKIGNEIEAEEMHPNLEQAYVHFMENKLNHWNL